MIPLSHPLIGSEEEAAVLRVLRSGQLAMGPEVEAFESEFSTYIAGDSGWNGEAVAVANGTLALLLALLGLGIGPGDEVLVPSLTFVATANAVRAVGAVPVFVDVLEATYTLDPSCLRDLIGPRTAAVIPVHLYGHPADMDQIGEICQRHGLYVIEDAAQAHGAAIRGRRAGTFGIGCFSFYPTKNMTTGEGGMVTSDDPELVRRMRLIRNHGMVRQYEHEIFGLNLRMTEIAAAVGRVQLGKLEGWNESRRNNAEWYRDNLHSVAVPQVLPGVTHVFHQFTVRTTSREQLLRRLRAGGIGAGVYYPTPLHLLFGEPVAGPLPVSERLAAEVLSLPVRPDLTQAEMNRIAEVVNA